MSRVSVLLPVYNAGAFLPEAIESVLCQSWADFEVIAIDDGSTDDSLSILEKYALRDARIQVISRENRGLIRTLNEGIKLSRGEFIARMDADDIALPDRFAAQVSFLDTYPDVVVVGGQILLIDEEGRTIGPMSLPCDHERIDTKHMSKPGGVLFHPAAMMRIQALKRVGNYNEKMEAAEDFDLWLRLAEIGRLANLDRCVLKYRQHVHSVGYSQRKRQRMAAWRAIRAASERRGLPFDLQSPEEEPPVSVGDIYRKWGWWALRAGNVRTARHYARQSVRSEPFCKLNWRLLICAIRGW